MIKIAFDVGGVLSKYPGLFKKILWMLIGDRDQWRPIELYCISDMHPVQKIRDALELNGFLEFFDHVLSADHETYGERCKQVLCEEHGIDVLIDDFQGYLAGGKHVRMMVMPDPDEPYWHDDWKTNPEDGAFGRRRPPKMPEPPRTTGDIRTEPFRFRVEQPLEEIDLSSTYVFVRSDNGIKLTWRDFRYFEEGGKAVAYLDLADAEIGPYTFPPFRDRCTLLDDGPLPCRQDAGHGGICRSEIPICKKWEACVRQEGHPPPCSPC